MKKLLLIIMCMWVCGIAAAKGSNTIDKKIQKKCGQLIETAEFTKDVDDIINVQLCFYEQNEKFKRSNIEPAKALTVLYADKYAHSMQNKDYYKKMQKYAIMAIHNGSKDIKVLRVAIWSSYVLGKTANMEYAYEKMAYVDSKQAAEIYAQITKAKQEKKEISQQKSEKFWSDFSNYMSSENGKKLINSFIYGGQKDELGRPLADYADKPPTAQDYQLYYQKKQADELENINKSLKDIDWSLQMNNL